MGCYASLSVSASQMLSILHDAFIHETKTLINIKNNFLQKLGSIMNAYNPRIWEDDTIWFL